jgi:hypothetical protein
MKREEVKGSASPNHGRRIETQHTGSVTRTVPPSVVSSLSDGYATQVGAVEEERGRK